VEGFWSVYCRLIRTDNMPVPSDYHLFKSNIRPMWEDPENELGGKWMVRTKRQFTPRMWEDLILAFIGNQFSEDEVTGIVLSLRDHDIISVWTKNAKDDRQRQNVRNVIKRVLDLPPGTRMEYKAHASIITPTTTPHAPYSRGNNPDLYVVPGLHPSPTSAESPDEETKSPITSSSQLPDTA
jgi:hypothetical protein